MFEQIMTALQPYILEAAGAVVAGAITLAVRALHKHTGLQIEEQHRKVLHSAIMTGIRAALAARGDAPREAVIAAAVDYAKTSGAPVAIRKLKATAPALESLARAKLAEIKP